MSETAVNDSVQNKEPEVKEEKEVVEKDVFERTKADMFKYKKMADDLQKKIDDQKVQTLKVTQNWEELAKTKEQEAQDAVAKYSQLQKALIDEKKFSSLKAEALKQGIVKDAIDDIELIDFPEIEVESTTSGRVIIHGAERAVQRLKQLRPHWFKSKAISINTQTPEALPPLSGKLTFEDLKKFEANYKKNPSEDNKKAYHEAILKFKT